MYQTFFMAKNTNIDALATPTTQGCLLLLKLNIYIKVFFFTNFSRLYYFSFNVESKKDIDNTFASIGFPDKVEITTE